MEDVFVGRLVSAPVRTVGPDESVQAAARTMLEHDVGSLVVVDDADRVTGILTSTDFVTVAADDASEAEESVADYMSEDVVTTTANATIREVANEIVDHGFHHLPVVDDGRAVGIVTTTDLTAYLSGIVEPNHPRQTPEH